KRIETQTARTARNNENRFKAANKNVERSFRDVDRGASAMASGGLRQASMQLSQVAQQGAATGNYLQALAIQAPDLALGFGALGIAAGAAIPILFGVAQAAMGAKEGIEKIDVQAAYSSATSAIEAAREAQDRYTAAIRLSGVAQSEITPAILSSLKLEAQAREALAALEMVRLEQQKSALSESLKENKATLEGMISDAEEGVRQIQALRERTLNLPEGPTSMDDAVSRERERLAAVEQVLSTEEELVGTIEKQQAELDLVNALIAQGNGEAAKTVDQLVKAATSAEGVAIAAAGIPGALDGGVSAAMRLAEALGISLATAQALAKLGPQGVGVTSTTDPNTGMQYGGRGGDPREMGGSIYDRQNAEAIQWLENYKPPKLSSGGGKSGGGRGGKSEAERKAEQETNRLLSERDRILRDLEGPLEEYERKLADLNELQARGELTADQYNAALANIEAERFAAEHESIIDAIEGVSNAMAQAIVNGENMGEALGNVFKQIAAELIASRIQSMITEIATSMGWMGGGGAGNPMGSFGSGAGSLSLNGMRASGGTVSAGRAYMVGEMGPEPFIPAVNGRILSTAQAQQALSGPGGGGGPQIVKVVLSPSALTLGDDGTISARIDARAVQAAQAIEAKMRSDVRDGRGLARDLKQTTTARPRLTTR
ncbi:hypothetical protein, partial [Roseivivax isoporae]|uniref:hypothetical protein n=1 Tax=Roseivivax isoporae TaxID=591206 RepID=UPI0005C24C27